MNRKDLPAPNATCEVCGRSYRRCKKCIEMRSRGIEAWREHCDSIECYQTLILCNIDDYSKITQEEYDHVMAFELPENRKPIESIQKKLDEIGEYLKARATNENRKNTEKNQKVEVVKTDKNNYKSNYNKEKTGNNNNQNVK